MHRLLVCVVVIAACSSPGTPPGDLAGDLSAVVHDLSAGHDAGADASLVDLTSFDSKMFGGDAGQPSNVGFVTCGPMACDVSVDYCCATFGPDVQTCLANSDSNCPGGDKLRCDEPGDCPSGQSCYVIANAPLYTNCQATGALVVCKSDSDCAIGIPCVTQTCNSPGRAEILSSCGGSIWCTNHP